MSTQLVQRFLAICYYLQPRKPLIATIWGDILNFAAQKSSLTSQSCPHRMYISPREQVTAILRLLVLHSFWKEQKL